jgi:hypothetical protein
MRGFVFLRIVLAIVLIGMLVGAGVWIYNLGVANGVAAGAGGTVPPGGAPVAPYAGPWFHPWGWGFGFGFFPFGFLFPLVWLLIFFGLLRGLFFRRWHGYGPRYWGGPRHGEGPDEVPPMVAEWHRRMHAEEKDQDKA